MNRRHSLKRIVLFVVIVGITIFLKDSTPVIVFNEAPVVTAQWTVSPVHDNYIGSIITATIILDSVPGVYLDLSYLPQAGEVLELASNSPYGEKEGQLEIRSRKIKQTLQGDHYLTEIIYEFQYLITIDFSKPYDDKNLSRYIPLYEEYLFNDKTGQVEWRSLVVLIKSADFAIARRVDENSQPIFTLFNLEIPKTIWFYLRYLGFGYIGLGLLFLIREIVSLYIASRKSRPKIEPTSEIVVSQPSLEDLFLLWQKDSNYSIFIEAVILFRLGIWGNPQPDTVEITTYILYSGTILDSKEIITIFDRLILEVKDAHTA